MKEIALNLRQSHAIQPEVISKLTRLICVKCGGYDEFSGLFAKYLIQGVIHVLHIR